MSLPAAETSVPTVPVLACMSQPRPQGPGGWATGALGLEARPDPQQAGGSGQEGSHCSGGSHWTRRGRGLQLQSPHMCVCACEHVCTRMCTLHVRVPEHMYSHRHTHRHRMSTHACAQMPLEGARCTVTELGR